MATENQQARKRFFTLVITIIVAFGASVVAYASTTYLQVARFDDAAERVEEAVAAVAVDTTVLLVELRAVTVLVQELMARDLPIQYVMVPDDDTQRALDAILERLEVLEAKELGERLVLQPYPDTVEVHYPPVIETVPVPYPVPHIIYKTRRSALEYALVGVGSFALGTWIGYAAGNEDPDPVLICVPRKACDNQ